MITGRLGFNWDNKRYGVLNLDNWDIDGLHCGQVLSWYDEDNDIWRDDRIEADYPGTKEDAWYLVKSHLRGKELEWLQVRIDD